MPSKSLAFECVEVAIPAGEAVVRGLLSVAEGVRGVVVFAHGSGSGQHSPRNQYIARQLESSGFATLLVDLLDREETFEQDHVFDIPLLADRVRRVAEWTAASPLTAGLPRGAFGASTGAAAALVAAAERPELFEAVVSRGGRPDLAQDALGQVGTPTLLIVGGDDDPVLRLNRWAARQLRCPRELVILPGVTHLFPEPGALDRVAHLAQLWFERHLPVAVGAVLAPLGAD
ncbi:MAG: dienelactone hydrolase family protein [Gemmataceae bacterium]